MAEQQKRIHPVDAEAPASPSAPLAPRELLGSEKGDPAEHPATTPRHPHPPPYRRTFPVSHSNPPKRRGGCCCRCLCWTACLLLVVVVLLAATAGILYLVFQPKAPKYSVDRLSVSAFTVDTTTLDVNATFDVTVTATNPNKKIGISYEDGSHLSVWYSGASLCTGRFPAFYQGHRNTTVLTVPLSGQTQVGSELLTALQAAQQTGSVPLLFKGDVPVRVKLGLLKLWKVRFLVNCDLVVNSLSVNNQISIRTSHCRFKFRL